MRYLRQYTERKQQGRSILLLDLHGSEDLGGLGAGRGGDYTCVDEGLLSVCLKGKMCGFGGASL